MSDPRNESPQAAHGHQRESEAEEHRHQRSDDMPRYSVVTWATLLGALMALASSLGSYKVTSYRVDELEKKAESLRLEDKTLHEKLDSKELELDREIQVVKSDHNTRITLLEERYVTILTTLTSIDKKLEDLTNIRSHR